MTQIKSDRPGQADAASPPVNVISASGSVPNPDATARLIFLLPSIVIILCLSIFPLIVSLALSFARVTFMGGGININFVGFANYQKLLFGSQQRHLIGKLGE